MKLLFLFFFPLFLVSQELQTRTQALMGTFVNITLPTTNNKQISQSFNLIREIEHSLSSYDSEAPVYKLNHAHKVPYDDYLAHAIQDSKQYYKETQGYFDITIGAISKKLYRFGEENSTVPTHSALQQAKLNIEAIEVNNTHITTDDNITLDLGGMGKGYAVDVLVDFLEEQNISQGIVALSGDIRCLDRCAFELQSPYTEQTFASLVSLSPQLSISTSGTYRRYVVSQENHHLINPKTFTQGRAFVSVSLFTHGDNAKIDAYATALVVMPKEKALAFLKGHKKIGFVLVENNGNIVYGNLAKFVSFTWLDYKEKATMPNITRNNNTNRAKVNNLIHPDTTNPKEISK